MIPMGELPAVVSYPRSGTHWLSSLIYQWFYWADLKNYTHDSILPFRTWESDNAKSYPWANILGGHIHDPESTMAKLLHPRKIIYLFRSGREVLPSIWRLRMLEAAIKGWPTYTFPQFLRMRPPVTNDGNSPPEGLNVRDLCEWSQNKWSDADVFVVLYRHMIEDLDGVRDWLSDFLGLKAAPLHYPAERRVGYVVPEGRYTNDKLWEMV